MSFVCGKSIRSILSSWYCWLSFWNVIICRLKRMNGLTIASLAVVVFRGGTTIALLLTIALDDATLVLSFFFFLQRL